MCWIHVIKQMTNRSLSCLAAICLVAASCSPKAADYSEQLQWWEEARYGMFVHYGISSLEGIELSWPRDKFGAEKYDSLALKFNPRNFDANAWVDAAEKGGMKYIVLTTKHHDGFCLWDTSTSDHKITNTPYGKDFAKQLADAAHARGMRIGWYLSVRQWDDENCSNPDPAKNQLYIDKLKTQIKELLTNYGKIDLLWFDYEGHPCPTNPQEIFDYVREVDPDIVINNRLYSLSGDESSCYTGSCGMYATPEQNVGSYGEIPWETCSTSSTSRQWSIKFNDPPRPAADLIWETLSSAGGNGNMLMNVGPDSLGVIPPAYVERLAEVGDWFRAHEGILYGTHCGPWKPSGNFCSTANGKDAYLILKEGADITLPYSKSIKIESASIEGEAIEFTACKDSISFSIPDKYIGKPNVAVKLALEKEVTAPITAPSVSGSLAYDKPVKATSAMSKNYMHTAKSVVDDAWGSCWFPGRRYSLEDTDAYGTMINHNDKETGAYFMQDGAIEVDLGRKMDVSSFEVWMRYAENMGNLRIEYKHNGQWVVAATVHKPQGDWKDSFPTKKARRWRLVLDGCTWPYGIEEFQLFN